ncbi:hypothetical protein [Salinimonas chungwhensis]|uniref:hypothetical protein n=1 Tax=Salinimonas chungwhensis TaxID=265425 RepID=UPI0003766D73|nr:hypothetical protein [Salinimonas chungwhensis]
MRKIVHFSKTKNWFYTEPDLDLLNRQIAEIESNGWNVISVQSNCNFFGVTTSYTLLIDHEAESAI